MNLRRRDVATGLFASLLFAGPRLARAADRVADPAIDAKEEGLIAARARMKGLKSAKSLPLKAPRLVVHKADRTLELFDGDTLVKSYGVSLGLAPDGPKRQQGDYKTPEGRYFICYRNRASAFHLFLGFSYPNATDAESAQVSKLIDAKTATRIAEAEKAKRRPSWDTPLGGAVGIHGGGSGSDWTWGCVALENADMDEIWVSAPEGTPLEILP